MADEFSTAAVCGGGWWNPTRSMLGSYLCSASMNDIGSFAWPPSHHDAEVTAEVKGGPPITDHSSTAAATDDWNQVLMQDNERGDRSYGSMPQEDLNYEVQQTLTAIASSSHQELSTSFPITSYNYPPNLLKSMFDADPHQPHQQCLIGSQPVISYAPPTTAATTGAMTNYGPNLSDFSPSTPKFSSLFTNHHLQFPSSISLWNSSLSSCSFPSPTFTDKKPAVTAKSNGSNKELRDSSCLANKTSTEPDFKRPRIETPSPLPTFKVRKEKLGDRITALQQLVSPFGKTDTASVLHEAIEYIKFLHDQVNVLITPYMKNGSPSDQHCQQNIEEVLDEEGLSKQDLRSRGLCLVPMSSTFPVAAEATTDFWTPTFGANFR